MHKTHFSAITVVVCGLTFVALSLAQSAPEMPKIEGESLAGHKVVLPDAAAGRVTVLIFGFSKASKAPTSAWASKLQADFRARPDFALYQLPVLEDVPRFVRKMVISGIKKGVPEGLRDHFVPSFKAKQNLRRWCITKSRTRLTSCSLTARAISSGRVTAPPTMRTTLGYEDKLKPCRIRNNAECRDYSSTIW